MKIAHISGFYKPSIGGVEKVMEELAIRQARDGHEVHVFCSDFDKNRILEDKEETIDGIHIHRCRLWFKISQFGLIFPSMYKKLVKEHKNKPFDIVHSHNFGHLHFVQASKFARKYNIRHVHTTHCPWTSANRSLLGQIGVFVSYNLFSKKAMKYVDKVIAITPWELEFIEKYGGKEIEIIPNGMPKRLLEKIKDNDFKKKYKIKGKMVLFFGRLNITKGPEHFVKIAKIILKHRNDVTFVIRGPDEGLRQVVRDLIGNEPRIILLDETTDKSEVIKMYQAADVFVMPSYREGLPLCLFEAMACRLPIVASPVNGIPFEMKDKVNGFLVNYGDDKGFAERIEKLLDNAILRKKISKTNFEKAKQYDWDIIYKRYMKEYIKDGPIY
jgi:glycosyltransferase involved in cell wall biosynthesis